METEWLDFLVGLGVRSTVILGVALLAVAAVRRFSAEERHLMLTAAVVGLLVLPPATLLLPALRTSFDSLTAPLARWAVATGEAAQAALFEPPEAPRGARTAAEASPREAAPPLPAAVDTRAAGLRASGIAGAGPVALGAYAAVAALLLVLSALRAFSVSRRVGRLPDATHPRTLTLARRLAREAGLARRIRWLTSEADRTPWAWGVLQPAVVLPAGFESAPLDEQRNAIVHELAHVKRMDLLWMLLAQAACALYWLQPFAWIAMRRMKGEAEHACDDRVLLAGASGSDYADQLLTLARAIHTDGHKPRAALAMAGGSPVSRRIQSILEQRTRRNTVNTCKTAGALAAMLAVVGPLAVVRSQETTPEGAAAALGDPAFQALLEAGPKGSEELDTLIEGLLANGQPDRAREALIGWVTGEYGTAGPDDRACNICVRGLRDQGGLRDVATLPTGLMTWVSDAFEAIEDLAQQRRDPALLLWLANACVTSSNRNAADRGLHYLLQANLLGDTGDLGRLTTLRYLIELGQHAQARAIARALNEDAGSEYFQSQAMEYWLRYIDVEELRVTNVAKLASVDRSALYADAEFAPLYKEAPMYPQEAAEQRREGYVIVEYTVAPDGRTKDARVFESSDVVFDDAAVESVSSYRYVPRFSGGGAIETTGVRTIIRFALER